MAEFDVHWGITEDVDDDIPATKEEQIKAAVQLSFDRLQAHGNDWQWIVKDRETGKVYDVDFEFAENGIPEITEIKPQ